MAGSELEALYGRYASKGDIGALAEVFDRVAPDLARLGRMLVGDRQRAEDLVQETFLTAVEQPATYDRSRPLKPWLVGILVNRARTARRAAGQEFEADRLTERVTQGPDAEVSRQEYLAAVSAAVAELPAKLRTVVEARLAGRSTSELARELGISQGALRVRLHRALQRMRALLPPGFASAFAIMFLHSQGLAQVRARILAEAGKQKLAAGAGGSAAVIGMGSVWMTKKVLFAVSLAGILLVGAGLRSAISFVMADAGDEQGAGELALVSDDDGVERDASTAATAQPEVNDRTELASETPEMEVAVEAAPTHSLSGKVRGQDDRPVAGVSVTAWDDRYMRGDPSHEVKTNATGEFSFPELDLEFVITAQSEDLACEQGLRGKCTEGATTEGFVIRVGPAVSLSGHVVDPAGARVAGAKVWVANGLNSTSDRDITHTPDVLTFKGGMESATESKVNGTFVLRGLPQGSSSLHVEMAPYLVDRSWQQAPSSDIEVVLDAGLSIRGHVVDSRGLPAEGARVRMWPYWGNVHTVPKFVTVDANGDFLLTSAVLGEWSPISIGVIHEGHAIEIVPITEYEQRDEAVAIAIDLDSVGVPAEPATGFVEGGENVFVRLLPEQFLAGHVVDTDGNSLPGVELWIEGERDMNPGFTHGKRSTWEWALGLEDSETDEAGAFRFGRLYPGTFEIHAVSLDDEKLVTDLTVEAGDEDIRLVLDGAVARKVVFTGTVTDAVTGEPIEVFTVIPMIDGSGYLNEVENTEGQYELVGYREGEIEVKVHAPGYAESVVPKRHYSTGENVLDFALAQERTLEVSVVDSGGKPLRNGSIKVRTLDEQVVWIGPTSGSRSTNAPVRNGKAVLHGLPAERLTLHLDIEGEELEVPVDLTQPPQRELEIIVDPEPEVEPVRLELFVLSERSNIDTDMLRRFWASRDDPEPAPMKWPEGELLLLDAVTEVKVYDSTDRLVAELKVTPLGTTQFSLDVHTYKSKTSQSFWTRENGMPAESLTLPGRSWRFEAKAPGYQDLVRTLRVSDENRSPLMVLTLVPSGG